MKSLLIFFLLVCFSAVNLQAQTKQEKIRELFQLMKADSLVSGMIDNMAKTFRTQATGLKNPWSDSVFTAYVKQETMAFSQIAYGVEMVDIYDRHFTTVEIDAYLKFYKSAEGQKMIAALPGIQKEFMQNVMSRDMPVLQEKMMRKLQELKQ